MNFEKSMQNLLKAKNDANGIRTIALVEGWSKRMQMATNILVTEKMVKPLLVFETRAQFTENPTTVDHLIIEEEKEMVAEFVQTYFELRKGKETLEAIQVEMLKAPLFSAMLVKTNKVDGVLGGIYNPTANILKAAFKAIGPVEGVKTISSVMIMHRQDQWYIFSDISVNPTPNKDQLVDIAKNASDFGDVINFKKKIAFLSFSTAGSAAHPSALAIREATVEFNERYQPKYHAIGEIQFDAAFDLDIRAQKYPYDDGFKKMPTIFVFPDLNAGNIGYKIAQRMGNFGAVGPIITGLKQPMNDLSRGSTVNDIVNTAIITALQAFGLPGANIHE